MKRNEEKASTVRSSLCIEGLSIVLVEDVRSNVGGLDGHDGCPRERGGERRFEGRKGMRGSNVTGIHKMPGLYSSGPPPKEHYPIDKTTLRLSRFCPTLAQALVAATVRIAGQTDNSLCGETKPSKVQCLYRPLNAAK